MKITELNSTPIQVSIQKSYVDSVAVTNSSGGVVYIKLYDSALAPSGSNVPEFSWQFADGSIDVIKVAARTFTRGCWIAASLTDDDSLDAVPAGVSVNVAGEVLSSATV